MIYKLISVAALFLCSVFFSGSETALFSLNPFTVRKMQSDGIDTRNIKYLLRFPIRLLADILIGNTLVNVAASTIFASLVIDILGYDTTWLSIVLVAFIVLLFCEIMPKRYAVEKSARISRFCAAPMVYVVKFFTPINRLIERFTPDIKSGPTLNEEELKGILDAGRKRGIIDGAEKDMVDDVLEFTDTVVEQIMTKREDIKAAPIDMGHDEFRAFAKEVKHSKIPVYKNSLDHIMGIVSAKEMFLHRGRHFTEILKPVLFVPGTKRIKDLLRIFERDKLKIAVVLSDSGRPCGLVTVEDIMEEVFGEIYDEFEKKP